MTYTDSYNPWHDFIVFPTDSIDARPLREFLKMSFYYAKTTNKAGDLVFALYDAITFSRKDNDFFFTLCRAISYITTKPVYLHFRGEKYEITIASIIPIATIPERVPQRESDMPGPFRCKWGSTEGEVWGAVRLHKERAIIAWMKKLVKESKKNDELKRTTVKALEKFQARTNQSSPNSPAWRIIELFFENDLCLCLWAYDKKLSPEQNYAKTVGIIRILSEAGHKGFAVKFENKPELSFIFTIPDTQDIEQLRNFLLGCSLTCNHSAGLYKAPDNRLYKISVAYPSTETMVSSALPVNEKQLGEILASTYGSDCQLPGTGTFEEIKPPIGQSAIEKRARIIQVLNQSGINAIADILNKSNSDNTNGKLK